MLADVRVYGVDKDEAIRGGRGYWLRYFLPLSLLLPLHILLTVRGHGTTRFDRKTLK